MRTLRYQIADIRGASTQCSRNISVALIPPSNSHRLSNDCSARRFNSSARRHLRFDGLQESHSRASIALTNSGNTLPRRSLLPQCLHVGRGGRGGARVRAPRGKPREKAIAGRCLVSHVDFIVFPSYLHLPHLPHFPRKLGDARKICAYL